MAFRDFISRSNSPKRSSSQESNPPKDGSKYLTVPSPQTEITTQDSSKRSRVGTGEPVKGLRKASSVSTRRPPSQKSPSRYAEAEPSDYLYFGEGVSAANVSQSLAKRSRSKSTGNMPEHPSSTARPNNHTSNTGKDNSGFVTTGISTHTTQMGYSNVTYGGSLQFDYSGIQVGGPGF